MEYKRLRGIDGEVTDEYLQHTREDGTICIIPNKEENADWQYYQAWLAADEENQPEEAD